MLHRVGAIPFDIKEDRIAILFVTSQRRGRWILPKGLIEKTESHKDCCIREAYEEAGIRGEFLKNFPMTARIGKSINGSIEQIIVTYYPLLVTHQEKKWPERDTRQRRWVPLENAARFANRDDIRQLVDQFSDIQYWVLGAAKLKKKSKGRRKRDKNSTSSKRF